MATKAAFDPAQHFRKLQGQDYLDVKWRLVWFRENHPNGVIAIDPIEVTADRAVFLARVENGNGGSSTGVGSETKGDFKDFIEKAETKAVGRALAMLGFGTQFALEDDGDRIADTPVQRKSTQSTQSTQSQPDVTPPVRTQNGNGAVDPEELASFMKLVDDAVNDHGIPANQRVGKIRYVEQKARKRYEDNVPGELEAYIAAGIGDVESGQH